MSRRIRSVKPEWLDDEKMGNASDEARVLSIALMLMADDYGRGRASIAAIASGAWQYQMGRDDGAHAPETLAKASRAFRELLATGFVVRYEVAGQQYYEIRNWSKHQRVDKVGKPQVPAPNPAETHVSRDIPETFARVSRESRETLATDLDLDRNGSGGGGEGSRRDPRERATAAAPVASQGAEAMLRSLVAPTDETRAVVDLVSETRQAAGGAKFRPTSFADREAVQKLAEWAKATETPPDRLRALLAAFWGSKGTSARLSWLTEEDPGRYLGQKSPAKVRGQAAPATHAEHAAAVAQAIAEGRPHGEGWADVGI